MTQSSSRSMGSAVLVTFNARRQLISLKQQVSLPSSLSHVVGGNFGGTSLTDLLCYDRRSGSVSILVTDYQANLRPLCSSQEIRRDYSHVVVGQFFDSPLSSLFCYDARRGLGDFYRCQEEGGLVLVKSLSNLPLQWHHIAAADLFGNFLTDLLFYNRESGRLELATTDGMGNLVPVKRLELSSPWWDDIVPLSLEHNTATQLLFYSRREAMARLYAWSREGSLSHLRTYYDWGNSWEALRPIQIENEQRVVLFCYARAVGIARWIALDAQGTPQSLGENARFGIGWNEVVEGRFTPSASSSLWCYDSCGGSAEAESARRAIEGQYQLLSGPRGELDVPLYGVEQVADGWVQQFLAGEIYWRPMSGAHDVRGRFREVYNAQGGPTGPLGLPTSDAMKLVTDYGFYQAFDKGFLIDHQEVISWHQAVTFRLEKVTQTKAIVDGLGFDKSEHNAELAVTVTLEVNGVSVPEAQHLRIPARGHLPNGGGPLNLAVRVPLIPSSRVQALIRAFDVDLVGADEELGRWELDLDLRALLRAFPKGRESEAPLTMVERRVVPAGESSLILSYSISWPEGELPVKREGSS